MKKLKTITPILLLLVALFTIGQSCTPNLEPEPAPEEQQCDYEGLTFNDTSNNTQTLISESDLTTDFFNTSSNGPEVEIYKTANPSDMNFVTTVVTEGATGTGTLMINGTNYPVNVTCQKTGNAVGDEMRFKLTATGIDAKFCVIIDQFH